MQRVLQALAGLWLAAFCATVMMVLRIKVASISEMSTPRNDLNTWEALSSDVLYVTEMSCVMCCPSRVGRSMLSSSIDEPSAERRTIVYVRSAVG